MSYVVEVRLDGNGRTECCDPGGLTLRKGDSVLVETQMGLTYAVVSAVRGSCENCSSKKELKKISRVASPEDVGRQERNREVERELYAFCYERVKERDLPMSLVGAECLFEGNKVMVYFTADGRIDFRELVKDLVQRFHMRIEMRQIGVRHQARMVGGLGTCGRQLCCTSFLADFDPVSIKMAKEQNLSLNPSKISGMCGRLMCCLSYEYLFYENAKKDLPKVGKRVKTVHGEGKVIRQNIFRRRMTVLMESGEEKEISYEDIVRDKN